MSTPLDLYAITQMRELDAARLLIGASMGELWAMVTLCSAKAPKRADKQELVAAILARTHPREAAVTAALQYQQERLV